MSLPSQESQSDLNQCPNLTATVHNLDQTPLTISPDDLIQQFLNSQFHPDVEVGTGSVAQNGDGSSSCRPHSSDMLLNELWDSYVKFLEVDLSSVPQTEGLISPMLTSKTDMPRPGGGNPNELPQQFDSSGPPLNSVFENITADQLLSSDGDVETEVRCSEPNRSHLDLEERPSDHASNGPKRRGLKPRVTLVEKDKNQLDRAGTSTDACNAGKRKSCEPTILTEEQENEKKRKKNENDRKYRADIKNELTELRKRKQDFDRVMKIASSFGGIDQMESQINRMNFELQKSQQEVVGNDMFQQVIIDSADRVPQIRSNEVQVCVLSDKYKEMEAECHRLQLMKSKYGEIEEIESMLDKFKNLEVEFNRLELMKSKYGEIEGIESMLNEFKSLEAESHRFEQIKLLFGGVDEIEPEINRLKKIELQLDKYKQMENQKEMDSFQVSPGSVEQLEIDQLYRQQKEADLDRFEQMKTRHGGTEAMEFMLDKLHRMETELQRFEQIKSEFGGIDEIEAGMYRLKKIESQRNKQKELQFFTESPGSLQDQRGTHPLDLNSDSDMVSDDEINLRLPPASVRGTNTMHDMQYSDALVTEFMAQLDDDKAKSNVDLSSFKDLDGEREKVGNYNIPLSLVSTAGDVIKAKNDITKESTYSPCVIEPSYILLCAATKEMKDLSLEQVTEEIMLKCRDAINNPKGLGCDTEFAKQYLKKLAQGFFGLKAKSDRERLEQRMTNLKTEEEDLKKELAKKTNELKVLKAKQEDLTSEQCEDCQKVADQFLKKTISVF